MLHLCEGRTYIANVATIHQQIHAIYMATYCVVLPRPPLFDQVDIPSVIAVSQADRLA